VEGLIMNRKSGVIIAAGLVFALMAGTVSRGLSMHQASAAPVRIVVQTAGPQSPPPVTTAGFERE
jgi:hypothetical protein